MLIDDLLNIRDLDTMLTEGYVRFGIHPIFPIFVYLTTLKGSIRQRVE